MPIQRAWNKSLDHGKIKLDLSKVLKENWGRTNLNNGYESYTMEYHRLKHKKVSVACFKGILYEKYVNNQKASLLLEMWF